MWAHVWLTQSHAAAPGELARAWRARWAEDAERFGQAPMPFALDDPENAGVPYRATQDHAERRAAVIARDSVAMALAALRTRAG